MPVMAFVVPITHLVVCCWVAAAAFRSPDGVYRRTAAGFGLGAGGLAVLIAIASATSGSGAGLGLFLIFLVIAVFGAMFALAALAGASARHLWDVIRR